MPQKTTIAIDLHVKDALFKQMKPKETWNDVLIRLLAQNDTSTITEMREAFERYTYFPKTKIDYWTFRKLRSLKSRNIGAKSWAEFFKFLTRDINLEPTIHERVTEGTAHSLLGIWMQNFSDNLPYIRYGDNVKVTYELDLDNEELKSTAFPPKEYHRQTIADLVTYEPLLENEYEYQNAKYVKIDTSHGMKIKNPPEGSAIVVGRGPSLFKHKHPEMLAEAIKNGYKGLIVTSDGGMKPLLDAGVIPDVVVTVDGAPIIKKFFEHPLLTEHGHKIKWITSVTVSHEVYLQARKNNMPVYWFNPKFDDWRQNESWTRIQALQTRTTKYARGIPMSQVGGNAGACAWIMAMELLHRAPIALIGIDFGYPEETKLQDTQYYSSVLNIAKGDVATIKEAYKKFYHPDFKANAYVDLIFYHYRQAFLEMQNETPLWYKLYGGTINCTEGGTLFGDGITCMPFKSFLEKYKQ